MTESMQKHLASFTVDSSEAGYLYYFAPAERGFEPYLKQVHVQAIIDLASDGTLAGVELIDGMPPPPTGDEREMPSLREAHALAMKALQDYEDAAHIEEANWSGWGEQTIPDHATWRRVKAGQALAALRDAEVWK